MLIQAFNLLKTDYHFYIAGTGPELSQLKRLAANNSQIHFLGFISDKEMLKRYSQALFIPFIPYDEDYGLVTIEAMKSAKAVLTTTDAGGVNEFVQHNLTGLCVKPEIQSIADAMKRLIADPQKCHWMGQKAKQKVSFIQWNNTIQHLIQKPVHNNPQKLHKGVFNTVDNSPLIKNSQRKKIVVTSTFHIWPSQSGGQNRIYYLYREIAKFHDVYILVLCEQENYLNIQLAPGLNEIRIPKSVAFRKKQQTIKSQLSTVADDITAMVYFALNEPYLKTLMYYCSFADLVIASHPYLYPAIKHVSNSRLWYEAHNVEYDLKKNIFANNDKQHNLLNKLKLTEQQCCQQAEKIITCCDTDAKRLQQLYKTNSAKMITIANGVNIKSEYFNPINDKVLDQKSQSFKVIFIGSWHGPNIESVNEIKKIAHKCHDIQFLIMGSVCSHPVCNNLPQNIHLLGTVSDYAKEAFLNICDLAINPMLSGSGTNLKILEYTALKLAVLSTPYGMRGLNFIANKEVFVCQIKDFPNQLQELASANKTLEQQNRIKQMINQSYKRTKAEYSWQTIAVKMLNHI